MGLTPRAAHFSQNWSNLAPTGRSGTTVGTFVTRFTELNLSTQKTQYLVPYDDRDLSLYFVATLLQKEHGLQHHNLQLNEFLSLYFCW